MHLFGLVALGYMWARMAQAAKQKLAAGANGAGERMNAKLGTGRFFVERMLPDLESGARTPGAWLDHIRLERAARGVFTQAAQYAAAAGVAHTLAADFVPRYSPCLQAS